MSNKSRSDLPLKSPEVISKVSFFNQGGRCIMEGSFKTIPKEGEEFFIFTEDKPMGSLYKVMVVKRYYYCDSNDQIEQEHYNVYLTDLGYGVKK